MRAVYRQLNPFQFNAVEFNPREAYRLLLGEEPPKAAEAAPAASAQQTLEEIQNLYLPALQRLSEARLAGQPADPVDEAAILEFQRRSVSMLENSAPAPVKTEIVLPDGVIDLGESWRAIHLLLTGKQADKNADAGGERREGILGELFGDSAFGALKKLMPREAENARNLFSMAIFGGAEIAAVDTRISGPARLLSSDDVRAVASALDKIEPSALLEGYATLEAAGVPAPSADELARQYDRLRHFYMQAASEGNAVITCMC